MRIQSWWTVRSLVTWSVAAIVVCVLVLGADVFAARAATATLHPDAISIEEDKWLSSVSGEPVTDATDLSSADGSDYIYYESRNGTDEIRFSVADGSVGWTISSVTMYVVAAEDSGAARGIIVNAYSGGTLLTPQISVLPSTGFTTYSELLTAPDGGWTPANLATLQVGLAPASPVNTPLQLKVDEVYFVVDYTEATPSLTVAQGTDDLPGGSRPAAKIYTSRSDTKVVDEIALTATNGDVTVSQIVVRGLDTAANLTTDVTKVQLFVDDGDGVYDAGDSQLGSDKTFSGAASGSTSTFDSLSLVVTNATTKEIWIVYTVGAAAIDGDIVGVRVNDGDVSASTGTVSTFTDIVSAGSGQTIEIDAAGPSVGVTSPSTDDVLTGTTKLIDVSVSDARSGVDTSSVDVRITRGGTEYWNGTGWTGTATWLAMADDGDGTSSYSWSLDDPEERTYVYTVTARADDDVGNSTTSTVSSNIRIDNVAPIPQSPATSIDTTHADLYFSEDMLGASIDPSYFSIDNGLSVTGASLDGTDKTLVHMVTSAQTPGTTYTITVTSDVTDLYGNVVTSPSDTATFTGYGTILSVTSSSQPTGTSVMIGTSDLLVDGFVLQRAAGASNISVSSITINDTGTVPGTDVDTAYVYADDGDGVWEGTGVESLVASQAVAGADTTVNISQTLTDDDPHTYWVVYDIAAGATDTNVVNSLVTVTLSTQTDAQVVQNNATRGDDFTIDASGPSVSSAASASETQVVVTFSEALDPASIDKTYFTISGLTITVAAIDGGDPTKVILTTDLQTIDQTYTVVVKNTAPTVTDIAGNPLTATSPNDRADFTGFDPSDSEAPSVPANVAASAGTTGTIAIVTWDASTDDVGVTGYKVWRSTSEAGSYVNIDSIAATSSPTYNDTSGVPGQEYWYKVSAYDAASNESALSAAAGPVTATWLRSPHDTYTSVTELCGCCHVPHDAAAENILKPVGEPGELGLCFSCHDGTGASTNIKTGATNSFALSSGHEVEEVDVSPDLTNVCSGCHSPHHDYTTLRMLPKGTINTASVTVADNEWCFACHNDAQDWYDGTYPELDSPTRDATGYPTAGTYPGQTTYLSAAANGHSTIPTTAPDQSSGDCLHCHASHMSSNGYDALIETYSPSTAGTVADDRVNGTYAASCFYCHGGTVPSGFATAPVDIEQFATYDGANDAAYSGHRIKSAGGTLPVNAPLPCYDCHNPHGSSRGNSSLLFDELGQDLDTSTDAGVRQFCFACHSTSDTTKGWDSVSSAWTAITGEKVEGLSRDGGKLLLPDVNGHLEADVQSCYACHGNDYSAADSSNVHNPGPGISTGGTDCYTCHSSFESYMEHDGTDRTDYYHHVLGDATYPGDTAFEAGSYPTSGTDVYCLSCHVDHDKFNAGKGSNLRASLSNESTSNSDFDPATDGGVCVDCHSVSRIKDTTNQKSASGSTQTMVIDGTAYDAGAHDYTEDSTYDDSTTFSANCSKCHSDEQTKSLQTSSDKFSTHYSAEDRILAALGVSLTNVPTEEDFCYECHSTTQNSNSGSNLDAYGVAAMSDAALDIESEFAKTYTHPIDSTRGLHTADEGMNSNWNPSASRHVECEDCHNPHEAQSGTTPWPSDGSERTSSAPAIAGANLGVWGVDVDGDGDGDWAGTGTFGGVDYQDTDYITTYTRISEAGYQWQMCLKCHSTYAWGSAPPNVSLNLQGQTGGKQTDVGEDFNPKNYSVHPIFAIGKNQPGPLLNSVWNSADYRRDINGSTTDNALSNTFTDGWLQDSRLVCTDCHHSDDAASPAGPHGSTKRWLLSAADENIKTTYYNGGSPLVVYTNSGIVSAGEGGNFCVNCHRADVYGIGDSSGVSYLDDANLVNAQLLSRVSHNGDAINNACNVSAKLATQMQYSSCLNCHGGRKDSSSFSFPATTVVQSGAIHGTSMGPGLAGDDYTSVPGDPMGYRFMNGASWASHMMGDTSGSIGCSTLKKDDGGDIDNYSSCDQHDATGDEVPNYYYARPTS